MIKYHFSEDVRKQTAQILEPFKRAEEWSALEIPELERPNGVVMLTGLPGTGKTTIAYDLLKRVTGLPKANIICLQMGGTASEKFGQTERAIVNLTNDAIRQLRPTARPQAQAIGVFIDECDAIVWSRDKVNSASMFMLSVVNTLLLQVDRIQEHGGLIVLATNHENLVDSALESRITDRIHLTPPIGEDAKIVWRSLMPPEPFGFTITDDVCDLGMVPRDIKNFILREARAAFLDKRSMSSDALFNKTK